VKIAIYCGAAWEPFTPDSLNGPGIGGSETAVIHMARELQQLGAEVAVYGEGEGEFESVKYIRHEMFNPAEPTDVLVAWRSVAPFTTPKRPNAKRTVLWLHDIGLPLLPAGIVAQIDTVFVLSRFHGMRIVTENPSFNGKFWYARNGIDITRFNNIRPKVANRFFYSSSPRRGLGKLLDEWPQVRKRHPDAELNVAYGFELSIRMAEYAKNYQEARIYKNLLTRVENTEGVVHHGRLGQLELAALQSSCVAWLYPPSDFEETFCITALEAQMARCVPISRNNGALPEVLKHFYVWKHGISTVTALEALSSPNWPLCLDENFEFAKQYTWANEAKRWMEFFDATR